METTNQTTKRIQRDQLLAMFEQLNDEGQYNLLEYAEALICTGKYHKKITRIKWARKHK